MTKLPLELSEQTKINLKFNNFYAVLVSLVIAAASFVATYYGVIIRLEKVDSKIDLLTQSVNDHIKSEERRDGFTDNTISNIKISLNDAWKDIITLNTLHNR